MNCPYAGRTVLDCTGESGMYAGALLAGLGFEVIKIEKPGGDPERSRGPFAGEGGKSIFYATYNAGKKSFVCDIFQPEGREQFLELVKTAQLVLISETPSVFAAAGLGYEELKKINPGIILASISPFGSRGPYKEWRASSDLIPYSMGGQMYEIGTTGRGPLQLGHNIVTNISCLYLAFGILAALHDRDRTGEGRIVEVSMQTLAANWRSKPYGVYQAPPYAFIDRGVPSHPFRPVEFYRCRDGEYCIVFAMQWRVMIDWMKECGFDVRGFDAPKYFEGNPGYNPYILDEVEEVNKLIEDFFCACYDADEVVVQAQKRRIAAGKLTKIDDVFVSEQFMDRGFFVPAQLGDRQVLVPGAPIRFTKSPCLSGAAAPEVGQHTQEILSRLGSDKETQAGLGRDAAQ